MKREQSTLEGFQDAGFPRHQEKCCIQELAGVGFRIPQKSCHEELVVVGTMVTAVRDGQISIRNGSHAKALHVLAVVILAGQNGLKGISGT